MTRRTATLTGFGAVILWSLLAFLTVRSAPVPPLLLNALTFALGGAVGIAWVMATGGLRQLAAISWKVYAFGTAGLFGYHLLYFTALRLAPAAEAGLIAYLWPLLIVLFSGLLPGERLRPGHVAGALIAFAGAALIVATGTGSAAGVNVYPDAPRGRLLLDPEARLVGCEGAPVHLDLGAIGKGYALDLAAEILREWEMPVRWRWQPGSRLKLGRDGWTMLCAIHRLIRMPVSATHSQPRAN